MTGQFPPLPPFLPLFKAVKVISDRLGQSWEVDHLLGCAARGEIKLKAISPANFMLARVEPKGDGFDIMRIDLSDSFPLSADDASNLQIGGVALYIGTPTYRLVRVRGTASAPPKIWPHDCRVSADDIELLIAKYGTKPPAVVGDMAPKAAPDVVQPSATVPPANNNVKWTDAEMRTLWDESLLPGATKQKLGNKYGVTRQRIATLLKVAQDKFRTSSKSTFAQLEVRKVKGRY